ncbi:MAG: hypothetical protein Q4G43_02435 [Mobilicoccus sp.]|nr:hypothetical protein [Mobilicoccus sp.]
MSDDVMSADDRQVVHMLAFAGREFDRVHDLLVGDDEPGEDEVVAGMREDGEPTTADEQDSDEGTDHDDESDERSGPVASALRVAGAVVGTAGRLVTGSVHPRHDDWENAPLDDRIDWWVGRFGTAAAALAAIPGLGGKIGRLTQIGDVVGAAAQILVVHAVGREMGVTDLAPRVTAAANVVLGHDLTVEDVAGELDGPDTEPDPDAPGDAPEEKTGVLRRVGRTAALVWRVANRIRRLRSDLGNRQQGGFLVRAISNLPGLGAAGAFFSERKGIRRAADKAAERYAGQA